MTHLDEALWLGEVLHGWDSPPSRVWGCGQEVDGQTQWACAHRGVTTRGASLPVGAGTPILPIQGISCIGRDLCFQGVFTQEHIAGPLYYPSEKERMLASLQCMSSPHEHYLEGCYSRKLMLGVTIHVFQDLKG